MAAIRLLTDSREGNPSRGIPVSTVVPAGTVLNVLRTIAPCREFPEGGWVVRFPATPVCPAPSDRAVAADRATLVA